MATRTAEDGNGKDVAAAQADLEKQIATLRKDISALTETVGSYGRAQSASMRDAATHQAELMRARGEEALSAAQIKANQAYHATEDRVRENPAAAVGIAAGVGFLVGLFTARR